MENIIMLLMFACGLPLLAGVIIYMLVTQFRPKKDDFYDHEY